MRRQFAAAVCLVLALALVSGCSPVSPEDKGTPPEHGFQVEIPHRLTALFFLNGSTGWLAGYSGDTITDLADTLLATTDAGATWTQLTSPSGLVLKLGFVDTSRGWAVAETEPGSGGYGYDKLAIFATSDGGKSWTKQWQGPLPQNLSGMMSETRVRVSFSDAKDGYVLAGGTLLSTKDGGTNWTPVSVPNGFVPDDVSFVNGQSGWIAGQTGGKPNTTEATGPLVFSTSDGGKTWKQVFSAKDNLPRDNVYWGDSGTISFTSATEGWLYFKDSAMRGYLYHTTDGGTAWQQQQQDLATGRTVAGALAFTGTTGWLPVASGAAPLPGGILLTEDGGAHWTAAGSDREGQGTAWSIGAISLVSPTEGWAIGIQTGAQDFLVKTTDSGATWQQTLPALSPTDGMSLAASGEGLGIGLPSDRNAVLATGNGGKTWNLASVTSAWPVAVFDGDNGHGWIVTNDPSGGGWDVMRTRDRGKTLLLLATVPTGTPGDLVPSVPYFRFFDDTHGILQTLDFPTTVLLATSDGGKTWQHQCALEKPPASWSKFSFITPETGYMVLQSLGTKDAAGNRSTQPTTTLMKTSDGGRTWAAASQLSTDYWVQGLSFITADKGVMLVRRSPLSQLSQEQILTTADGGKTWQTQVLTGPVAQKLLDADPEYTQLHLSSDGKGWVLSPGGLLYTPDAGATWSETP